MAIECAIAIQRTLRDHRAEHGFAPALRIGLHTAEASRRGGDYFGMGIHAAARIAASGGGGDIVVSGATVSAAGAGRVSDRRSLDLKGFSEPIEVATLEWD